MGGKLRTNVNYRPHSVYGNFTEAEKPNSDQRKQTTFWHPPPFIGKRFFINLCTIIQSAAVFLFKVF